MDIKAAGADLRMRRERRGWSREVLEKRSGVSQSAIKNYEEGERPGGESFTPNRSKLRQIADAFGYPEGAEILQVFGFPDMAAQFEQESLTVPDDLGRLTPEQQEIVREITRLVVALASDNE